MYIKRYGEPNLLDCLERNEKAGVVYHREGIVGDYDDIGLLKPAEIDDFTGYRYYREEQLFAIGRITSLKDMGFALADIIKILDSYDDKEKMDAFLSERQMELSKLMDIK